MANDTFYLIINKEGKFNYSNKGFQNSPHYVTLTTAKYRAKDIILGTHRFYDPQHAYHVERALALKDMKVRAFKLNAKAEMLVDPDKPDLTLREFVEQNKMEYEVDIYDKIMRKIPAVMPADPPKTGPIRISLSNQDLDGITGIQIKP